MSVAVWRAHLLSCRWLAKHAFPGRVRTNHVVVLVNSIVNIVTMAGSAYHKPRGHNKMELFRFPGN